MLGLKVLTDHGWAAAAMRDAHAVLVDHAHCELKAAANALSLVARNPGDIKLARGLTDLAQEEIHHFQRVMAVIGARGLILGPPAVDAYASALRRAAHDLPRPPAVSVLVDRLLVGALIEARSCERFQLLAEVASSADAELHALWRELLVSEARHYRTFVDLAVHVAGGNRGSIAARLEHLSEAEAVIVSKLAGAGGDISRATIHG